MQSSSHFNRSHRVYFRTIGALTLTSIVVFLVLCVAYYQRLSSSIIQQHYTNIQKTTLNVSSRYDALLKEDSASDSDTLSQSEIFLKVFSEATNTVVWVVDQRGVITYSSEIPKEVQGQLEPTMRGSIVRSYKIPDILLKDLQNPNLTITNSMLMPLFSDPQSVWITASASLTNAKDHILIHENVNLEKDAFAMLSNVLGIPVVISFSLSLLLFVLVTRSFIRPIRLLSEAAIRVSNGDLSTRISVPEENNDLPTQFFISDELTEMIQTVNGMIEKLERQDSDRRVFITSIAHDLRTPITSIKGFISAMLDGTIPPEKVPHYLQIVSQEVDRLQHLIQSVTEISTLSQKEGLTMEAINIIEIIFSTLNGMDSLLKEKHLDVQMESDFDENTAVWARGDQKGISRVVYNLISNAIKFTPENGAICICVHSVEKTNQVIVSVEDSGPGIPKDKESSIFQSFFKLDTSRSNEGSGLGLYICKEILSAHEQKIFVENGKELGGAKFTFTLQMAAKDKKDT